MPTVRQLFTEQDFHEAIDKKLRVRVFHNDHLIDSGSIIIRFTGETVITQSSVSELAYHPRQKCQFFEVRK